MASMIYQTSNGKTAKLGKEIGSGGEGSVFRIIGQQNSVAKIYNKVLKPDAVKKLQFMARHSTPELLNFTAWPEELLLEQGAVIGYTMPIIENAIQLHEFTSPLSRAEKYPDHDWRASVVVAMNLAISLNALHTAGHVVGDINARNVLLNGDGTVRLIDSDSFQITDSRKVFHCPVGDQEFTPPELLNLKSWGGVLRTPNHDYFGLAVLIFQLLFEGLHPFTGKSLDGEHELPWKIKHFRYPYAKDAKSRQCAPPIFIPFLPRNVLPRKILNMFEQAFTEKGETERPDAKNWYGALKTLHASLTRCAANRHTVSKEFRDACPWCRHEAADVVDDDIHQQATWSNPANFSTPAIVSVPPVVSPQTSQQAVRKTESVWSKTAGWLVALVFFGLIFGLAVQEQSSKRETKRTIERVTRDIVEEIAQQAAKARASATRTNSIGMEFILVPSGSFMMGSGSGHAEQPVRRVTISQPFYLGKYEVTQRQWEAVMGNNPSEFKGPDNPVEKVSWDDAQEFIRRLNRKEGTDKYRLPTEAEWEYAARAGTTKEEYSFGNDASALGQYAWYEDNSGEKTHPVGQKKPNPWGFYDMHGNVWEWVQDWYGDYSGRNVTDPKGPSTGSRRVLCGGSWRYGVMSSRYRIGVPVLASLSDLGFRLALSLGHP